MDRKKQYKDTNRERIVTFLNESIFLSTRGLRIQAKENDFA